MFLDEIKTINFKIKNDKTKTTIIYLECNGSKSYVFNGHISIMKLATRGRYVCLEVIPLSESKGLELT